MIGKKISVRVNAHMSKIMHTPIKIGLRTYATYTNCRTLGFILLELEMTSFLPIILKLVLKAGYAHYLDMHIIYAH